MCRASPRSSAHGRVGSLIRQPAVGAGVDQEVEAEAARALATAGLAADAPPRDEAQNSSSDPSLVFVAVVCTDTKCVYRCAYRLASATRSSLQLRAAVIRSFCSFFQFIGTEGSLFRWTFNPKIAGSRPARPIRFAGILSEATPACVRVCVRAVVHAVPSGFRSSLSHMY